MGASARPVTPRASARPALSPSPAVAAGGVPTAELAKITAPVLVLGGANSLAWFRRSAAAQAAAIPGARLQMIDGYDHNAPPEVITPILTEFFSTGRVAGRGSAMPA
jgi:pimeloyl-ACP methyl ester carboxylesterase